MSIKGNCAEIATNPSGEKHVVNVMPTIGLYVQDVDSTRLVALGKIYDGASTIHNLPYANDVVNVSVGEVYDGNAQVLFSMLEVQYVRQALDTFIAWSTYLVKPVSLKVFIYI